MHAIPHIDRIDGPQQETQERSTGFEQLVQKTRMEVLKERLWPRMIQPGSAALLYATTSWVGLWAALPPVGRGLGLAFFLAATLATLRRSPTHPQGPLWISRNEACQKIDSLLGTPPERPAEILSATLHKGSSNLARSVHEHNANAVWKAWSGRMIPYRARLNLGDRQHKALYALTLSAAAAGFIAGPEWKGRLTDAFDWSSPPVLQVEEAITPHQPGERAAAIPPLKVEAWINPPEGVPRSPHYLAYDSGKANTDNKSQDDEPVHIHKNSAMTIHIHHPDASLTHNGRAITADGEAGPQLSAGIREYHLTLTEGEHVVSISNGPRWTILASPDLVPEVIIHKVERPDRQNNLIIDFSVKDDSGIFREGTVNITPADDHVEGRAPLPARKLAPDTLAPGGKPRP